jgi:hypothetical protein
VIVRILHVVLGVTISFAYIAGHPPSLRWATAPFRSVAISLVAVPIWPYCASLAFCWNLSTPRRVRPLVFIAFLIGSWAFMGALYLGYFNFKPNLIDRLGATVFQFLMTVFVASWAFDDFD